MASALAPFAPITRNDHEDNAKPQVAQQAAMAADVSCPRCGTSEPGPGKPWTSCYLIVHKADGEIDFSLSLVRMPVSELGTAILLKAMHAEAGVPLLYAVQLKAWKRWDGSHYLGEQVTYGKMMAEHYARWYHELAEPMRQAAALKGLDKDESAVALKPMRDFGKKLWSENGQTAVINQVSRTCWIDAEQLDRGTGLIVVDNCVIDIPATISAGRVIWHNHDPSRLITRRAGRMTSYDPDARCPLFDQFMATSVAHPDHRAWLIWRAIMAWAGLMPRKGWVNVVGEPDSGKTTFMNLMLAIGGSYVTQVDIKTFMVKPAGDSGFLAAELRGARMVVSEEPEPGGRYDVGFMKNITGRGAQRTAGKYEKPVSWIPQLTQFLFANDPIRFPTSDTGMMSRQEVALFSRGYEQMDALMLEKMIAEAPGILNRMLEQVIAHRYDDAEPVLPPSMIAAREAMADETENALRFTTAWLHPDVARLALAPGLAWYRCVGVRELFDAYEGWCERKGVPVRQRLGEHDFSRVLGRRWKVQRSNGKRFEGLTYGTCWNQPGIDDDE